MIYELIKMDGKHEFIEKPEKLQFTCDELLEIFGGWFILRWAYSEEGEDSNGKKIETDYWICSADTATAKKHSLNVNKEAQAYLHIEDPIYGPAIVAPRSCF